MENIIPGFHRRHHKDEDERYDRHGNYPPRMHHSGEYTGQPVGFEHVGIPPEHEPQEIDARTIAELGYEGPEGERRKVEAIKEQLYREYEERNPELAPRSHHSRSPRGHHHSHSHSHSPGYSHSHHSHSPRHRGEYEREYHSSRVVASSADYPEIPEGYAPDRHGHLKYVGDAGWDRHNSSHGHHGSSHHRRHKSRDSDSDEESYARRRRYEEEEYRRRYGVERPPPVKVERKYDEDGTVVERISPMGTGGYTRPDHGKIHYGRQESFADDAASGSFVRQDSYPAGYAPPYNPVTTSYGRRPYQDEAPEYPVDERNLRY